MPWIPVSADRWIAAAGRGRPGARHPGTIAAPLDWQTRSVGAGLEQLKGQILDDSVRKDAEYVGAVLELPDGTYAFTQGRGKPGQDRVSIRIKPPGRAGQQPQPAAGGGQRLPEPGDSTHGCDQGLIPPEPADFRSRIPAMTASRRSPAPDIMAGPRQSYGPPPDERIARTRRRCPGTDR